MSNLSIQIATNISLRYNSYQFSKNILSVLETYYLWWLDINLQIVYDEDQARNYIIKLFKPFSCAWK